MGIGMIWEETWELKGNGNAGMRMRGNGNSEPIPAYRDQIRSMNH